MEYEYRPGGRPVAGRSAQEVGEELERIERERGAITTTAIVEESTPETAVLHAEFEWDNERAAHEHRLSQARRIPRVLRIVEEAAEPRAAYVHIPKVIEADADESNSREGRYVRLDAVVERPDLFHLAVTEAERRLSSAQRALNELMYAARKSVEPDKLALIMMAAKAIETAGEAMRKLH